MHYDGNGNAIRDTNWQADAANGVPISAPEMDTEFNGTATCLTNAVTRDGQSPMLNNFNAGNFRITQVGNGTALTDAVNVSQVPTVAASSTRNLIRNGTFQIAQRATSFASPATGTVTVDGWRAAFSGGTGGTFTVAQSATATVAFNGFVQPYNSAGSTSRIPANRGLRWTQSVVGTATAAYIEQRIPNARQWSAVPLIGNYCWLDMTGAGGFSGDKVEIGVNFGTGGSPSATQALISKTFSVTYASLKYRDFSGTLPNFDDNGVYTWGSNLDDYLYIRIYLPAGTTTLFDSICTGVTLLENVGANATAFAFYPYRSFDEDLTLCQRYYYKTFPYATAPAQNAGATGAFSYNAFVAAANASRWNIALPQSTWNKLTPTVTTYNPSAANANWRNVTGGADSGAATIAMVGERAVVITNAQAAGDAVANQIAIHFTVDAEP